MDDLHVDNQLPADVSGALRYERVAKLEATLALREKNARSRLHRWLVTGVVKRGHAYGKMKASS